MSAKLDHAPSAHTDLANSHGTAWCLARRNRRFPALPGEDAKPLHDDPCAEILPGGRNNSQSARAHEIPRRSSRRPGILIVDDDVGMRELLNAVLIYHGFIAWWAGNGRQAIELYQKLRAEIDLVLLDVQLPGLDGPQTLESLQKLNPELCCCFMTGGSGNYTDEELLERGALQVFRKPFHLTRVAQLLWRVVDLAAVPSPRTALARNIAKLLWRVADLSETTAP
jgi:CheY-like chemotaxis protein